MTQTQATTNQNETHRPDLPMKYLGGTVRGFVATTNIRQKDFNGKQVTEFSVGSSHFKKGSGDITDWVRCKVWTEGKMPAKTLAKLKQKGAHVHAKGRMQIDTWVNDKGPGWSLNMIVDTFAVSQIQAGGDGATSATASEVKPEELTLD